MNILKTELKEHNLIVIYFDDGLKIEHSPLHKWYKISDPTLHFGIILEEEIVNSKTLQLNNKNTMLKYQKHLNEYGHYYRMAIEKIKKINVLL